MLRVNIWDWRDPGCSALIYGIGWILDAPRQYMGLEGSWMLHFNIWDWRDPGCSTSIYGIGGILDVPFEYMGLEGSWMLRVNTWDWRDPGCSALIYEIGGVLDAPFQCTALAPQTSSSPLAASPVRTPSISCRTLLTTSSTDLHRSHHRITK